MIQGVKDRHSLLSVHQSQAMVHCDCYCIVYLHMCCSTLTYFICDFIANRSIASNQEIF